MIIRHYHEDKGQFSDNAFINSVNAKGQIIYYCGVNNHLQNRIAEKRISDLQEQATKKILHAGSRLISTIEQNLCPYVLLKAKKIRNK